MTTLLPQRGADVAPAPVSVSVHSVGEVAVLRASGDLDLGAVEQFGAAVRTALASRPTGLVLDLSDVAFCDTVGLRLLLSAGSRARAQGCSVAAAGLSTAVEEFLVRVCADRALPAYRDVSAAIEGLMFSGAWR